MGVSPHIGPPLLLNETLRVAEGRGNVTVNVEGSPAAHPSPSTFQWRLGDMLLQSDSRRTLEYATATINDVQRSDTGRYTLTASNKWSLWTVTRCSLLAVVASHWMCCVSGLVVHIGRAV